MTSSAHCPGFLTRFSCLGADCEDTCCKGWSMQVDNATRERYAREAPELMDAITDDADHPVMKRDPATDVCIKFEGGLCGIQRRMGEGFLGDACYFYPRVTRRLGDEIVMTAALSCPEVARLALLGDDAFTPGIVKAERLPESLHDYLPDGLTPDQALAVHTAFIDAAMGAGATPERNLMRIFCAAESLARVAPGSWPDAAPFYLAQAEAHLQPPETRETDPAFLLQALCGLVGAAKKVNQARLMQTIAEMERALHLTLRWDNFAITPLPDSIHATRALQAQWRAQGATHYAGLLKRYLATQLSVALFPFAGFGNSMIERAAIIAVRFATVRLALMSAGGGGVAAEADAIRAVQSLSRFLDHLAEPEFSLRIYRETGWLAHRRLRGLLGDG